MDARHLLGGAKVKMRARWMATAAGSLLALTLSAEVQAASEHIQNFRVPGGDLQRVLDVYVRQSGVQLIYRVDEVRGVRSAGVAGALAPEKALERILAGTAFRASRAPSGALVVSRGALAAGFGAADLAGQAASDDSAMVEEVVVTATKREETLEDVPMSVRALTGKALQRQGADQFADYYRTVPSLTFQERGAGFNTITVRGISAVGGVATTGVYFDDMPVGDAGFQSDVKLVDVERVEVLRGPQGTLYGEGSMGGTVRVITRKPDLNRFEGEVGGRLATTDDGGMSWGAEGVINAPIVADRAAIRISAYHRDLAGWIDNIARGETDVNGEVVNGLRASLKIAPSDRLDLTLTALYQDQEVGGSQNTNPAFGELVQVRPTREPSDDTLKEYNATLNWDAGFADFVSSTSYFRRDFIFDRDLQSLADEVGAGTSSLTVDLGTATFTEEARLASKPGGKLRWVVGVFYKDQRKTDDEVAVLDVDTVFLDAHGKVRLKQVALFGEADYQITDRLKATLGLRVFRETQAIVLTQSVLGVPAPDFDGELTSNGINPKVALDYQIDDDRMLYAVAAKGFRSGGVNPQTGPGIDQTYDPDHLWSYEAGFKGYLFDRRATFNVAAFYIDWNDIQISVPDPNVPGLAFLANAGKAHSTGVEAELTARPVRGLELGATLGINEAKLHELTRDGAPVYLRGYLPNVPRLKASLSADYSREIASGLDAFGRVDWSFNGASFNNIRDAAGGDPLRQKSYSLTNLRFGLRADRWELEAFVENLTNEIAALNIDPGLSSPGNLVVSVNRPRTIGVAVRSRF